MNELSFDEIERFRELVAATSGLSFGPDASQHLASVLRKRLRETGCSTPGAYLERLQTRHQAQSELRHLAPELTVAETYFFRHPEQYRAFTEIALRRRLREADGQRPVRILSAGCASGEEAYSLAALAFDQLGSSTAQQVEIIGIDINPTLLQKAERACYMKWSMRAADEQQRQRHFRLDGRHWTVKDAIRTAVRFEERNLLGEDDGFWQPEAFDIVFCRNVMIYFASQTIRELVARIAGALCAGGFLFLGPSETLRGVSQAFHLCHSHDAFYYERRDAREPREPEPLVAKSALHSLAPLRSVKPVPDSDSSWFGAIGQASQRIASLATQAKQATSGQPVPRLAAPSTESARSPRWNLGAATELLRQERFADVLEALGALPPDSETDPDVLILRAVVLTNAGKIDEAEQACLRVLSLDEMNAGAHYLCALCREHTGHLKAAIEHDQTAIYLDGTFAMPRLHLGLIAQRQGDTETMERELRQALSLLAQEDAARILLFGGGFHRESLVQLCRNKLKACGATL